MTYPVIDIHTHIFNAHFVPVTEILRHKFGVPKKLAKTIGVLLNETVGVFPLEDSKELPYLEQLGGDTNEQAELALLIVGAIKKSINYHLKARTKKELGEKLKDSELYKALKEAAKIELDEYGFPPPVMAKDARKSLSELLVEHSSLDAEVQRLQMLNNFLDGWIGKRLIAALTENKGMLRFVSLMLYDQKRLVSIMLNDNYHENKNVRLFVHLMMDMEPPYWQFSSDPVGSYLDYQTNQIAEYEARVRESDGRLVGFVAYDPRRAGALSFVKKALRRGNVGIKLYPPMGYRPDDNRYKTQFKKLFDYCVRDDIPIITHCTPVGFEAIKGWGEKHSHPDYWGNVLEQWPNLRVCFGHSGGGTYSIQEFALSDAGYYETREYWGWFAPNDNDWEDQRNYSRRIIELCQHYPNAYCDLSYLHELFKTKKKNRFVKRLTNALNENAPYNYGDKVMYGSDWHMSKITGKTDRFLEKVRTIVDKIDPELAPKVFNRNAVSFLQLQAFIERQNAKILSEKAIENLNKIIAG